MTIGATNAKETFKLYSSTGTLLGLITDKDTLLKSLQYLECSDFELVLSENTLDKFMGKYEGKIFFDTYIRLLVFLKYPTTFSTFKRIEEILENESEMNIQIGTRHRGIGDFVGQRKNAGLNAGLCIKCPMTNKEGKLNGRQHSIFPTDGSKCCDGYFPRRSLERSDENYESNSFFKTVCRI